jgi:hypothetical protein
MAWHCISPQINVKGFMKCWISNAMDRTDDMVCNGSVEYGSVRGECEEDDTDYLYGDSDSD